MTFHRFSQIAALSGFISVLLGAFGAHALKVHFSQYQLDMWQTAVFYQFIHTLLLLFVSRQHTLIEQYQTMMKVTCWCLTLGITLFCGSLYLLALSSVKTLGMLTPIGGFLFMSAWLCLFLVFIKD